MYLGEIGSALLLLWCGKAKVTVTVLSKQLMLISLSSLTTIQEEASYKDSVKHGNKTKKCFQKNKMTKANKIITQT